MIPGELLPGSGKLTLNAGQPTVVLHVENTGDRPVQVGSHYHFYEVNEGLTFDREKARGMRLDIAAGTAVRFEPGSGRDVTLIPYRGARRVFGFNAKVSGDLEPKAVKKKPTPKKKPIANKKPAPKTARPKKAAKPKSKARARRR